MRSTKHSYNFDISATKNLAHMSTENYLQNIFNSRELDDEEFTSDESEMSDSDSSPDEPTATVPFGTDTPSEDESENFPFQSPPSSETATIVKQILIEIDKRGFSVAKFLNGLSWGDTACTQDPKICYERTSLLHDPQLVNILHRWISPPRPPKSKKKQPEGASPGMKQFVIEYTKKTLSDELENLAPYLVSTTKDDIKIERLISTTFEQFEIDMQEAAPFLWGVLKCLATPVKRRNSNINRNTTKVSEYRCEYQRETHDRIDNNNHYIPAILHTFTSALPPPEGSIALFSVQGIVSKGL